MTKWNELKVKIQMLSKGEQLILLFICAFVIALFPGGYIAALMVGEWESGFFRKLVLALTTGYGIISTLIFAAAITFIAVILSKKNTDLNSAREVDDRGMITSNAGTYGTAGWMSESQAKKVYEVGPVEDVTGTILGQFTQDGEEVIALPFEPTGNRNLILIGPPGSGKSFGYVRTAVFQSIVRGESVVVTDPKGEIHNDMRKLLESRGYEVKVFNLINLDLSNAWDCVQEIYDPITGNIDDQRVIAFCKTVITNTGGGGKADPFWESSEENLFRVAVSYCAFMRETTLIKIYERRTKELLTQLPFISEDDGKALVEVVKNPESAMFDRRKVVEYLAKEFYGEEEGEKKLQSWEEDAPTCNISDIYNALMHNDLNSWEENFKNVPLNHPAASAWAVFKGMGERVQPNIVGGLNTRLQLFMTYKVRRVISNDDIRLADIGAKKTALFLIISDDNASMQLLSSLLLSFLFKDLKEAFDAVGGEGRIPVNVVADELANTGVWPNFEKTIATARSRKIAVSLILQSLPQLTQLYGEENAETIIGCCNTMLVLGCNDKYTAEYISDKSGIVTIRAKSVSDSRANSTGIRGVYQGYSLSEGDGKRMYKSVIIGKTCAMIPKIITGNKYGKAVMNPGKNGIADNLLTLTNLEQVYARNYFVPTNTLGVELLSRTVTLTRDDLNQMIEMWLSEMTNTHTCVDAREYTEAYIDDDSEKTLIFPIIELEELVYQKAGREKYHIVCERGTQDGISRTMGNKVIDFKDMNNEPMPAHKYDDAGIRRDGINPLTHSGYWEEEP